MLSNSSLYSGIHELLLSDYLVINKSNKLFDLIVRMEKAPRVTGPNVFLLNRPRGFGLSLAVEAIYNVLERTPEVTRDPESRAFIDSLPQHHTLILNLKTAFADTADEFKTLLMGNIQELYWEHHIKSQLNPYDSPKTYFAALVRALSDRHKNGIVILIDNYDVPFITASQMKPEFRQKAVSLYLDMLNVIKHSGERISFCLLTGHRKFPLASELSEGVPLVADLSSDPAYETLFGFTKEDVENVFREQISALAPRQGVTAADYLNALERCYGGFCFSDTLTRVMCPASIQHALSNDGLLYPYSAAGDYSFLSRALRDRDISLEWLFDKDGQDPLFGCNISLTPQGKEIGSLLLQLGFATRDRVNIYDYPGYATWRYRYTVPNEDMAITLKILSGKAPASLALEPIAPGVTESEPDTFDLTDEE